MADEGRKEVFVYGVEDIEEELPLGNLLGEELIWEVLLHVVIALDHLEDLEHAQLLEDWDGDLVDLTDPVDELLPHKDLLDEVFVVVPLCREIVLSLYKYKGYNKVMTLTFSVRYLCKSCLDLNF